MAAVEGKRLDGFIGPGWVRVTLGEHCHQPQFNMMMALILGIYGQFYTQITFRDVSHKKRENVGIFPKSGTPLPPVWEPHVCEKNDNGLLCILEL